MAQYPLNAKSILDAHDRRSLVICNTVDRARYIYEQLTALRPDGVTIRLLHSRYLAEDRNHTEELIRTNFSKGQIEGSEIVVSTQAIEVGVDITSQVLHTELAPANSILQRAGRCARYEGDRGRVIIYPETTAPDESVVDLVENTAPYNSFSKIFQPTLDAFTERQGQHLRFRDEQAIISLVHGPLDRQVLQNLRGDNRISESMYWVMRGDSKRDNVSLLVRQVVQQQVIIHPEPNTVLEAPFSVPSFGFHPTTLQKYVKDWIERGNQLNLDWCVQYLEEQEDPDQTNRPEYRWYEVNDAKEAWLQPLIVVNPALASYDSTLGFLVDRGGEWDQRLAMPQRDMPKERLAFNYHLETYERHIDLVYDAFQLEWGYYASLAQRFERRFGWEEGSVYKAAQLAVLLHDVGKLSVEWQGWVRDYQQKIGGDYDPEKAYAHTDLQTDEQREIERNMPRRPWHAVEGAVAVLPTLETVLGDDHPLCYAVFSAIARHHAPFSSSHQTFKLRSDALEHVQVTFAKHMPNVMDQLVLWTKETGGVNKKETHPLIIHPDDRLECCDKY
ncbi:MAG: CRISPR-associated endonuclease Cas3'', partial [Phototrophicales bacterium]